MQMLRNFYMFTDSRYDSNYRKHVHWISATTSTANTAIAQTYSHNLIFFGASDLNIEETNQIHFQQTVTNTSVAKQININIILYAYDNNPTPIKQ